ncbi:MAG: hypothetical protein HeimC3_22380 [Candidatus Heimdallarchaeota archaeon LC_3]|nr:MAG: hypothetical protein HeimC3_22380 [Candidatus Heimdallarchaeota archaeon LC_3]
MSKYGNNLPQLNENLFITDGGLETTLIFLQGFELPDFAAFILLENDKGIKALREYYTSYISIARDHKLGFILESPTWRANSDWGVRLGYTKDTLAEINIKAIEFLKDLRQEYETDYTQMVISGCIGPRGDGYNPSVMMSRDESERYHTTQIKTFSEADADMVSAVTITYSDEAIGITRAAMSVGIPVVISFTLETDGRLPSKETLKDAIEKVDEATNNGPVYYMINCAHPNHFKDVFSSNEPWVQRIRGIRANASTKSHSELDEADELDDGNPQELGDQYHKLRNVMTNVNVVGGCCGTDSRHVQAFCSQLKP